MPSRLGHGLYKKIDRLKNIFRCIYITMHTQSSCIILCRMSYGRVANRYPLIRDFVCSKGVILGVSMRPSGFVLVLILYCIQSKYS